MSLKDGLFSKIIRGELPSYKIDEDERTMSFLCLDAIQLGHTLVVPKTEVNHWVDLSIDDHQAIMKHAHKIAPAILKATGCKRIGTAFVGFEVPHAHYHLIPMFDMGDMDFRKGRRFSEQECLEIQAKIVKGL